MRGLRQGLRRNLSDLPRSRERARRYGPADQGCAGPMHQQSRGHSLQAALCAPHSAVAASWRRCKDNGNSDRQPCRLHAQGGQEAMSGAVYPKMTCACFGCKRWSRQFPPNWSFLCRDHYMMVPKQYRRVHKRALRRMKANPSTLNTERESRIWRRCADVATKEALMGIGI